MSQLPPRYEAVRPLGEGGMGQVWLARDREAGDEVAIKVFAPRGEAAGAALAEAAFAFKAEFWAMASLRHPHLVAARDFGATPDGAPCFAMAFVPGEDLADRIAGGPRPEAEVRAWLPGVLSALAYLHGRGTIHGDLKPENLRVRPDGTAVLMDLGLMRPAGRSGDPIRGSLPYLAPEAIRGGAVDARADLYGLGAVLYHALAGRPPFGEAEPMALLRAHLATPPVPLGRVAAGVSPAMEAVVMRLLAKEPAARPADAGEVLAALGLAGEAGGGPILFGAPLVGRADVEAALADLVGGDQAAEAALVGGPGAGKGRLLGELRAAAQLDGRQVLEARGLGPEAPPYEALLPWLRALMGIPGAARDQAAPVLVRLMPELAQAIPGLEPAPALDANAERARLHAAASDLAAASPDAIWLLDDADALDPASSALAAHIRKATASGRRIWLETRRTAPPAGRAIALPPLPKAAIAALAEGMLGEAAPPDVVDRLAELAGGMPGAAEAILARWVRAGALTRTGGRWTAAAGEAAFDLPGGWAGAIDAELAGLPDAAARLARAAAVLGPVGDVPTLLAVAAAPEDAAYPALGALEAADFLVRDGATWRLTRPARARALVAALPAPEAAALHQAAAQALMARLPGPADPAAPLGAVLAVAEHLLAGPDPAAARPWIEHGARRACALGALDRAAALVDRALAAPAIPAEARPGLLALRALTLRLRGDLDAALPIAAEVVAALQAAGDPGLARELVSQGVLLQMKGRYDEAAAAYEAGIAAADAAGDVAEGVRGRLFAGRAAHFAGRPAEALERLADATARARAAALPAPLAAALALRGYLAATTDPARRAAGLAELDEAIALARRIGDEAEAMDALNLRGNVLLAAGRLAEAADTFVEGLALGERLGLTNDTLFFRLNLAAAALERGHAAQALAEARAAVASARDQGRRFPESYGLAIEGAALVAGGAPAAGLAALDAGLAAARAIGNRYVELPILALRAESMLLLGRPADAREALAAAEALAEEAGAGEHAASLARLGLALAALDLGAELGAFDRAHAAAEATGHPVARAHAARWAAAGALDMEDPAAAQAALDAGLVLAEAAGLDGLRAELRLLAGRLAAMRDDRAGAAAAYRAAEAEARALGLRALAIDAMAAGAEADPAGGGASAGDAAAAFESLAADLDEAGRTAYLAHPERGALFRAIDPGAGLPLARLRRLAELIADVTGGRGLSEVMARALAGFAELAEADRAFLLLYEGLTLTDQAFWGMQAGEADAFSTSLAFKALWSDEPLWVEDVGADDELASRASVQALALRSALGVPLHDGERTIGVVLADSRRVNPRFGPAEREAVRALAAHAATAIGAARARAAVRADGDEAAWLWGVAGALAGQADVAAACRAVAEAACARLAGERALVLLGADLAPVAAVDRHGAPLPEAERAPSGTVARWVFDQGEPAQVLDAQAEEDLQVQRSIMALGLRAIAAVPIAHEGLVRGVLYVDARHVADPDPVALRTMGKMAELLGAAISRAHTL